MSSYFVLKIQYVNRPPETRNISAPTTTIGRESGDIVLNDPQTSGRHSEIHFQNGVVQVRDVGSTNGTWFNGQRLTERMEGKGTDSIIDLAQDGRLFGAADRIHQCFDIRAG